MNMVNKIPREKYIYRLPRSQETVFLARRDPGLPDPGRRPEDGVMPTTDGVDCSAAHPDEQITTP